MKTKVLLLGLILFLSVMASPFMVSATSTTDTNSSAETLSSHQNKSDKVSPRENMRSHEKTSQRPYPGSDHVGKSQQIKANTIGSGQFKLTTDAVSKNEYYWDEFIDITGQHPDGKIEGITIYLFIDQSQTETDTNKALTSTTTDANGDYTFSFKLNSPQSNLGYHNYSLYQPDVYPDPDFPFCGPCAQHIEYGNFTTYDNSTFSTSLVNKLADGQIIPSESIDFAVSVTAANGNPMPLPAITNYSVDYNITFANGLPTISRTNQGLTADTTVFSESYPDNSESIFNNISVLVKGTAPNYKKLAPLTFQEQFNVTAQFTLTRDTFLMSDVPYTDAALDGQFIYRTSQNIFINGTFNSTTVGVDPSFNDNNPVSLNITGGGSGGIDLNTTTDTNGYFFFNFTLSATNFPDPRFDIQFSLSTSDPKDLLLAKDQTGQSPGVIHLVADVSAMNNVNYYGDQDINGRDNDLFYYQDGNNFHISGSIVDTFNNPARGVNLILHITDQQSVGAAGPVTTLFSSLNFANEMQLSSGELQTDSGGNFDMVFVMPKITTNQMYFTVNVTVANQVITQDYRWNNSANVQSSVFSFEWLDLNDLVMTSHYFQDSSTRTLFNDSLTLDDLFNTTWFNTYQNPSSNYYFNFTIRDIFNRVPYNLTLSLNIDEAYHTASAEPNSRNTTVYTINPTNNGKFVIDLTATTSFNVFSFSSTADAKFFYGFTLNSTNRILYRYAYEADIFGPDNLDLTDVTLPNPQLENINSENTNAIVIRLNWDETTGILDDNIRNVTLAFKATPTGGYNDTTIQSFNWNSVAWNYVYMTYDPNIQQFKYTFNFGTYGHGYYFRLEIKIFDLKGFGLNVDGTTAGGNTWTNGVAGARLPSYNVAAAQPGYDTNVMSTATLNNNTQPYQFHMGDISVGEIDINTALTVNGNPWNGGYEITSIQNNLTLLLTLPGDASGYTSVELYYRFLSNSTSGSLMLDALDTSVPYTMVNMQFAFTTGTGNFVYLYEISSKELFFGAYLDLYFNYTDGAGNMRHTQPLVKQDGSIASVSNPGVVVDTTPPVEQSNNFNQVRSSSPKNNPPDVIIIWANETVSNYTITYTVADIQGTGIGSVIIQWYLNGTLINNQTQTYVLNGRYQSNNNLVGDNITFSITIPDFLFQANYTVSYEILVTDNSNNLLTVNDQNNQPYSFDIQPTPVPPVEPGVTTIVTTDENGNTITSRVTTGLSQGTGGSNAFWIIVGFIGILGLLTLYYQRHNIRDLFQRRQRRKVVDGMLNELTDEIKRLGAEGKYRRAILLVWEGVERVSREILQAPRSFNQTAKEFAAYLSTVTIVDRDTLLTLATTFQAARYGKDDPTRDQFDDATHAFEITVRTIIESGARSRIASDDEDW